MGRHGELFEKAVRNFEEYQHTLTLVVKQLGDSLAKLESIVTALKPDARDAGLAAMVFQAQLENNRFQHLQLSKELRDLRVNDVLSTRQTRAIGPPTTPREAVWPRRLVFVGVGGGIGLVLAAIGVLVFARAS
jgi:uncharacterized protein involved in exopolysaccharide biosynthesis